VEYHLRWAAIALSVVMLVATSFAHAAAVSGQGNWETALQGRDLDGNLSTAEAYYDTALNITWLADANYAGNPMDWSTANSWATNLNPHGSGIIGWRLPKVVDKESGALYGYGDDGCNFAYSGTDCGYNVDIATGEMAHMFYVTLGNKAYYDTSGTGPQPGWGLTNTGPFSNLGPYIYWSATGYARASGGSWNFHFSDGHQRYSGNTSTFYAWAVHAGDVGAAVVPVPSAIWLFGSGLAGLIGFARRKKRAV
jgi:uncharacterized membrane protein YphA (DoxX/SURF4 family)